MTTPTKEQAEAALNKLCGFGDGNWSLRVEADETVCSYIAHLEADVMRKDEALRSAIDRLNDMLMGDDGQAWKEARKALPHIEAALTEVK